MLYTAKCFWPGVSEGELRLAAAHAARARPGDGRERPFAERSTSPATSSCSACSSALARCGQARERASRACRANGSSRPSGSQPRQEKEKCHEPPDHRGRGDRCRRALRSGARRPRTLRPLCAGPRPGCYPTIQAAVDAAHDGDTVAVAPGTFAGGITITKSIALVGSGAGTTIVRGGGPVITIGQPPAGPTLTVSISRLTITGGVNTTTPASFDPFGGGVLIYPTAQGATNVVTISDSVITGNRSGAEGGGIADIGQLTLSNTHRQLERSGKLGRREAKGGGIWTASPGPVGSPAFGNGSLTMKNDIVTGNVAEKDGGDGFRVEGGGIEVQGGEAFSISASVVTRNSASYSSSTDAPTDVLVDGAGVHVGDGGTASIANTTISDNVAAASGPLGEPTAASAGLVVGQSTLALTNSTISGNRVVLVAASTEDPGPSGSAFEFDGSATISNARVLDNSTSIKASSGVAGATGAVLSLDQGPQAALLSNSVISGNSVTVASATGSATIQGVGITNNGELELQKT